MTTGAAKCATGKGGAKCATGKGWSGSCASLVCCGDGPSPTTMLATLSGIIYCACTFVGNFAIGFGGSSLPVYGKITGVDINGTYCLAFTNLGTNFCAYSITFGTPITFSLWTNSTCTGAPFKSGSIDGMTVTYFISGGTTRNITISFSGTAASFLLGTGGTAFVSLYPFTFEDSMGSGSYCTGGTYNNQFTVCGNVVNGHLGFATGGSVVLTPNGC